MQELNLLTRSLFYTVLFIIIIDFVILMLLNAVSYLLCYYKAGRLIEELEG